MMRGSSSWKKSDEENWYDYDNQKWANAVTINNKKVVDSSNNGNTATIVNSTYSKIDDREAVVLDGSSSYIDTGLANVDLGSTWGVGLTFSFNNILNNGTHALYGNWEGGGGGLEYVKTDTESYIHMSIYNLNSKSYEITKVSFDIEVGKIYTVIGWIINDEIYLYIEDVGFSSKPTSTTFTYNPTTVNVAIGANPGASLSGYSNITVYDAALYNASGASSFGSDSTYLDNNIDKMFDKNSVGSMVHALYNFRRDNNLSDNTLIPMDVVDTMWVYIPRYSYTIGSEDGTNYYGKQGEYLSSTPTLELPGEVDVKFIGKDVKEKGSAKYIVSEGVSGWYTPDAFTFGDKELSGIWIGKFETSSSNPTATDGGGNVTTLAPMIKPNVTSWRRINHANFETVAFNMTASNNIYGFVSENVDIHASKSSEWATAVYLSQSKYGKLGNTSYTGANKEVYMNNFQYKTGCSSGVPSAESSTTCTAEYNNITDRGSGTGASGAGASTTGTIYGIYDMNGGAWDMTMSNYNKYSGATQTENSGYTGKVSSDDSTFTGIAFPDDKYYDLYTTSDVSTACGGKVCLSYAMSETTGWYNDFSFMVGVDTHVWQTRGGHAINPKNSGIFAYSYAGTYWAGATYRLILSPLK